MCTCYNLIFDDCLMFFIEHLLQAKNIKEAFSDCNQVLEMDENNIDALCDRAETYLTNEQFEKGMHCSELIVFLSFLEM